MPNLSKYKSSCEQIYRESTPSTSGRHVKPVKKVIPKRSSVKCSKGETTCSAAIIPNYAKSSIVKPKRTTRSECFSNESKHLIDFCGNCGDAANTRLNYTRRAPPGDAGDHEVKENPHKITKSNNYKLKTNKTERPQFYSQDIIDHKIPCTHRETAVTKYSELAALVKSQDNRESLKQYYKNENFQRVSNSAQEIKFLKKPLETIREIPEISTVIEDSSTTDSSCIFKVFSGSDDDDVTILDPDDYDSLRRLQDFRDENYFECHSVKSRIRSRGSATSLADHKCVYRFYLNDRLFPVPLNSDHNKVIRCTECYLPLDFEKDKSSTAKNINGTIQAKVKLGSGDDAQDLLLMLPVKEPLIIREKRKEEPKDQELVYFGVIKLDSYGNSLFNQTQPSDSLALKYQKGYREFKSVEELKYDKVEEGDVIVV